MEVLLVTGDRWMPGNGVGPGLEAGWSDKKWKMLMKQFRCSCQTASSPIQSQPIIYQVQPSLRSPSPASFQLCGRDLIRFFLASNDSLSRADVCGWWFDESRELCRKFHELSEIKLLTLICVFLSLASDMRSPMIYDAMIGWYLIS